MSWNVPTVGGWSPVSETPDWTFLKLASIESSGDDNALITTGYAQNGDSISVSVDGGAAYTDPKEGAYLTWLFDDVLGGPMLGPPLNIQIVLDVTTPPAGSSAVVVSFGIVDGASIDTNQIVWGAIDWDTANPRVRAGSQAAFTTAAADSTIKRAHLSHDTISSSLAADSVRYQNVRVDSQTGGRVRVNSATRSASINMTMANRPRLFLSVFTSGAIPAGPEDIVMSLKYTSTAFPGTW